MFPAIGMQHRDAQSISGVMIKEMTGDSLPETSSQYAPPFFKGNSTLLWTWPHRCRRWVGLARATACSLSRISIQVRELEEIRYTPSLGTVSSRRPAKVSDQSPDLPCPFRPAMAASDT